MSEQKQLANMLLVTLDGLAAEVERGWDNAAQRQTDWTERSRNWPGKDLALSILRRLAAHPPDPAGLRDTARELAREARLKLRSRQIQVESPPFAG